MRGGMNRNDVPPEGSEADGPLEHSSDGRTRQPVGKQSSLPSISFVLLTLAIVAAGAGAVAWAFARPDSRTVEIIIPTPGPFAVHVTGAIVNPGVYTLPPGSRVSDAVEAAGGLSEPSSINLAAVLRDGQQVVVSGLETASGVGPNSGDGSLVGSPNDLLLDLNTASPTQLEDLPGIGPARAASIVSFRERNGPILFVDDLTAIDGIGPATVDTLRSLVVQQ